MDSWAAVAAVLGGLALLANGLKALQYIFSPVKKISEVDQRELEHEKDSEKRFLEIEDALKEQEEISQTILKALFHLVNHEIDGNGIEGLKAVRNELWSNISGRS